MMWSGSPWRASGHLFGGAPSRARGFCRPSSAPSRPHSATIVEVPLSHVGTTDRVTSMFISLAVYAVFLLAFALFLAVALRGLNPEVQTPSDLKGAGYIMAWISELSFWVGLFLLAAAVVGAIIEALA